MRTLLALAAIAGLCSSAAAQSFGTAFTYQGELRNGDAPANGSFDLRFTLFTVDAGGSQLGSAQCADNVSVVDGRFMVSLDFGSAYSGDPRWLAIEARADTGASCSDASGFWLLASDAASTSDTRTACRHRGQCPHA